jgi:hypothetical protein
MEMFVIVFFVGIPAGYLIESFSYGFQKLGKWSANGKRVVFGYNLCAFALLWVMIYQVETVGLDNFSTLEYVMFTVANLLCIAIFGTDGFVFGSYIRSYRRFLNNEAVPAHLIKTEDDEEREAKIQEARKEEEYRMREVEAGLVAESEAGYQKDEIDHEAELEDILRSKK